MKWQQPVRPLEVQAQNEDDWHPVLVFRLESMDFDLVQEIADGVPSCDTSWMQWQAVTVDGRVFTSQFDEMRYA